MGSRLLSFARRASASRSLKNRRRTLQCESLEARQLLAVVTSLANSGPGTLRDAILGGDPTITFAISGTINLQTQLIVNRSLTIDGTGQSITINNVTANQRIFSVVAGNSTFRNLTITGGQITSASANVNGGAIRLNAATLTVENSTISNSTAVNGGGIAVTGAGQLFLTNSVVSDSFASNVGGGIYVDGNATINVVDSIVESNQAGQDSTDGFLRIGGGIAVFANAVIRDSIIRNNECETPLATGALGWGGGIGVFETDGDVLIENTEISGNVSDRGGGIALRLSDITVRGSDITGNTSLYNGGGIRIMRVGGTEPDVIDIEDTTFEGNSADGGGAIGASVYADSGTLPVELNVTGSTFLNNSSLFDGGAIELFGTTSDITNSTFANNSADNEGGGIWNSFDADFSGSFSLNFATVTGNTATVSGGGVFSGVDGTSKSLSNSILSGNSAVGGYGPDLYDPTYQSGTQLQANFNLVQDISGHVLVNGVNGNIVGQAPNLGPLTDNGGPTQTRMLLAGPGVDAADPSSTVNVDQRSFTRPGANSSRDMGAVEHDGSPATLNIDFNNDGLYNCDDMNLLEDAIDAGSPIAPFDVNGDGLLNSADVFDWLIDAGELRFGPGRPFKSGDANLDGSVDGSDFGIWNANKFTSNNNWCQADFNQDNGVDGSDFGLWNANKFTSSDAGRPGQHATDAMRRKSIGKGFLQPMATIAPASGIQLRQIEIPTQAAAVRSEKSEMVFDGGVRTPMAAPPAVAVSVRADSALSLRTGGQPNAVRESIFEDMAEKVDWLAAL